MEEEHYFTRPISGISKKVILEGMSEIISFSELEEFIDEPVETYSSGMKARLGFSTAMVLHPDILLIDEVLGVGDRNFKKKSSEAIKQKLRGNTTAVIVSHSEQTILELTNKALWIEKGVSMGFWRLRKKSWKSTSPFAKRKPRHEERVSRNTQRALATIPCNIFTS